MKQRPLKDFADVVMGQSPPSASYNTEGNGLPFFQGKAEFEGTYPRIEKWCDSPTKIAEQGDVLISVRAPVGPTNICPEKACIGRGLAAIRPKKDKSDAFFLLYYFRLIENQLANRGRGSTFASINREDVETIKIPEIDYDKQRFIAQLLSKAESALEKRRQTLALADEFLQSAFLEMFGDPNRKEFRREIAALGDADIAIIDGDRGTNYPKQNEFSGEGYCLFLNTKNVTKRGFAFESRMFVSQEKDMRLRKGRLERNDLVLTTRGTVGNIAVYDDSIPFKNVRINSGMVILRPNLKVFKLAFLDHLFRSEYIKNQILTISSGCAQPQLPISSLKQLKILVPSLPEQQKFADLVQKVGKLKEKQKQSETQLQNLFNSLMQGAFKGEIFL